MKTRWYKQLLSVVLVMAMLIQILPLNVLAETMLDTEAPVVSTLTNSFTESEAVPATIVGEEISLRTETEKHFRLSDGSYIAVSYGMPVHYQDNEGSWQDIDNSLTLSANQASYASANAQVATTFATDLSTGRLMSSQNGDVSVTMYLLNGNQLQTMAPIGSGQVATMTTQQLQIQSALTIDTTVQATLVADINVLPVTSTANANTGWTMEELIPEKLQSTVLYEDVYPGIDLRYTAYSHNVKEQIIVNAPQEAYRYDFFLELEGLTAVTNTDNSISLTDREGDVRYTIPAPFMEDYLGATSTAVIYTLTPTTGGTILTVEADADWLNHEDREFPVSIDPTLEATAGNSDDQIYATYVVEGTPGIMNPTHQHLYFGYGYHDTVKEQRIFLNFHELPTVPEGATVVNAELGLYMFRITYQSCSDLGAGLYEVTETNPDPTDYRSWIGSFSWNSQPEYDTSNMIDYTVIDGNPTEGDLHRYYYWDMTELVKKWYETETEDDAENDTQNRTVALAITEGASEYGPSYCNVPVFMAYGDTNPPVLVVNYRDTTGIEDYYTYAALGAGSAGSAYIADATGQMTVAKELVSYASAINPFSLNLVYNSSVSNAPAEKLGYTMNMGTGWRLDVLQTIEPEVIGTDNYMRYSDGDGTIHYFLQDKDDLTTFYDEDGLGLCITRIDETTLHLVDDQDNICIFTKNTIQQETDEKEQYLLSETKDNNENRYILYITDGKITSIAQKNNGVANETTVATFGYTGDLLTSVTNAANQTYTLNYSDGKLLSITRGSTTLAEYDYLVETPETDSSDTSIIKLIEMVDSESGYKLGFEYNTQWKVAYYAEYDKNGQQGAQAAITYDGFDKTTYQDYGNDRLKDTDDDISTHYLFDNSSRTVNVYSTDAARNVVGASMATYFDGATSIDRRNNRTLRTASIGVAAIQELTNSGFENANTNYLWNISGAGAISTDNPRTGVYALKGTLDASNTSFSATKNSELLMDEQTYTLSAYVNTSQMTTAPTTGIRLLVTDTAGNSWNGDYFKYITSANVDGGWMRITLTFTAETSGVHQIQISGSGGVGSVYVDDLQLELGSAPSNRNMLENGNAQINNYGWTFGDNGYYINAVGMHHASGVEQSLAVPSAPAKASAKVSQTVPINKLGAQSYVLSGWAMGNAVPDNVTTANDYDQDIEKAFGLRAVVNYEDETTEYFYVPFNADVSDWQFASLTIVPTYTSKLITSITVSCAYEKNANIAYFDNISLVSQVVQSMTYDTDGNLRSVKTPGQSSDANIYEDNNLIKTFTGTGGTLSYTYDRTYTHRLRTATDGSTTQTLTYDQYGNLVDTSVAASDGSGLKLSSGTSYYSGGNLPSVSADANWVRTGYFYDNLASRMQGQPTRIMDANGTTTRISYDGRGRVQTSVLEGTAYLGYTYTEGNLTRIIRSDYTIEQHYNLAYDSFGNMTSFAVGTSPLVTYEYGANNGQLLKQTYANIDTVTYTYDNLGRVATTTYADGRMVSYTYTGDGQLYSVTETGGDSPAVYLYTYDSIGNLIASEKKDPSGNSLMRVYQNYDASGQLVGQSVYLGDSNYSESYTYNKTDGSLATMTTGTGQTLSYTYDALKRLTAVSGGMYTKNYTYRDLNNYYTTEQISQLQYTGLPAELTYGYTYDALGNIATYTASGKSTITYTYDNQGQLLSAVGDETYTYTYDDVGNVLTANGHTYTYGNTQWRDLLTAYDGETITYDASGNPLSYYNGTRWAFTWENGRSLATATDGTTNISYTYDANGLRTSKVVNGVTHNYLYASSQLMRETYGSNTLDFFYDASGHPYALKYNGTTYYYITNLQGDVMHLIDANENTVAAYEYDPYGNIVSAIGTMAQINPLRYRGYYYDTELEMYYLQSRYYDPQVGRFINADDVSLLGATGTVLGHNLFAYCENNPTNGCDPTGHLAYKVQKLVNAISIAALFNSYMSGLYSSLAATLVKIGAYVTGVLFPKVAAIFWYQPWVVVGVVAAAVLVVTTAVSIYRNVQVAKINNANMDKTVEEILKTKKASIKNAPLPPGGPDWKDILKKTLREIKELAQKNKTGYKEIYKLLTDGRFNIGRK